MNTVTWRNDLRPSLCKNVCIAQNKPILGRTQYLCVKDSYKLDAANCKELIFDHGAVSVQDIDQALLQCKDSGARYVFLIVNKYLVYTDVDSAFTSYSDLDLLLHWQSVLGWKAAFMSYLDNDRGVVGNFDFPVTQLLLERND